MKKLNRLLGIASGIALAGSLWIGVCAETYDIGFDSIKIFTSETGQMVTYQGKTLPDDSPVITGSTREHTLTVEVAQDSRLHLRLEDVTIDCSALSDAAAVTVNGPGSVVVELSGTANLLGGTMNAGLEIRSGGLYLMNAGEAEGVLNAVGGRFGAGIGGGARHSGGEITILNGSINACGGALGAGIGGGQGGDGCRIAILGGQISAQGGSFGAGIGGGWCGRGRQILLLGGRVTAFGANAIGSGSGGEAASDILVSPLEGSLLVGDGTAVVLTAEQGQTVPLNISAELLVVEAPAEAVLPEEDKPAEEAPAESLPEETVPAETAPEETVPEETAPEETVPEETVPVQTMPAQEADIEMPAQQVSQTLYFLDSEGEKKPASPAISGSMVDVACESGDWALHLSAEDVQNWSSGGVRLIRIHFGEKTVRTELKGISKWLSSGEEGTLFLAPGGVMQLMKNGVAYWLP